MKEIITKEVHQSFDPEQKVHHSYTDYKCTKCDSAFFNKKAAIKHYGNTHSVKEIKEICNNIFAYIESEEDAIAWKMAKEFGEQRIVAYIKYTGEGWYLMKSSFDYDQDYIAATPLEQFVSDLEADLKSLKNELKTIKEEFSIGWEK